MVYLRRRQHYHHLLALRAPRPLRHCLVQLLARSLINGAELRLRKKWIHFAYKFTLFRELFPNLFHYDDDKDIRIAAFQWKRTTSSIIATIFIWEKSDFDSGAISPEALDSPQRGESKPGPPGWASRCCPLQSGSPISIIKMVISQEGKCTDVVFVIEGNASLGAYFDELKGNYILPTLV